MTAQELNTLFAANLKKFRELKGWTRAKLADEADISAPMITHYEKGKRFPTSRAMAKLMIALDVDTHELFMEAKK